MKLTPHMDWQGFDMEVTDHNYTSSKKELMFCQNANCPRKKEKFIKEEMIKEREFLFCSKECKEAVLKVNTLQYI